MLSKLVPPTRAIIHSTPSCASTGVQVYGEGEWKTRQHGNCVALNRMIQIAKPDSYKVEA